MAAAALRTYCFVLAGLTLLAWSIGLADRLLLHWNFPWDWPLMYLAPHFSDLTDYRHMIQTLYLGGSAVATGQMYNYPAPALFVYWFFLALFQEPVGAFLTFSMAVWGSAFLLLQRIVKGTGWILASVLLTCLLCYPFHYVMDRGNIEIVIFSFVAGGLVCFLRQRYLWAALLFAGAACIKPFPVLFFYLFLTRKRYKEILLGLAMIFVVNIAALVWLGPTISEALASLRPGTTQFFEDYVMGYREGEIQYDHCFFAVVKQVIRLASGWADPEDITDTIALAYKAYMAAATVFVLWLAKRFWKQPVLNQIFFVILITITVPPVSYDYTLIYVAVLWGVYVTYLTSRAEVEAPLHFLIPMAILMTPQSWLRTEHVALGGQVKAFCLAYLLIQAMRLRMQSQRLDGGNI